MPKKAIKDYLREIGKKGGETTKKKGRSYFKKISKLGVEAQKKKKQNMAKDEQLFKN